MLERNVLYPSTYLSLYINTLMHVNMYACICVPTVGRKGGKRKTQVPKVCLQKSYQLQENAKSAFFGICCYKYTADGDSLNRLSVDAGAICLELFEH